jgi:thioredoxin-related protein
LILFSYIILKEAKNAKTVKLELLMQKTIIRKLPTLVLYKNGKVLGTHSGLISYEELESFIADNLRENNMESDVDVESRNRGKISFGSSLERDDYALGL